METARPLTSDPPSLIKSHVEMLLTPPPPLLQKAQTAPTPPRSQAATITESSKCTKHGVLQERKNRGR
jgi:hypothetical protein